eukprot:274815_1
MHLIYSVSAIDKIFFAYCASFTLRSSLRPSRCDDRNSIFALHFIILSPCTFNFSVYDRFNSSHYTFVLTCHVVHLVSKQYNFLFLFRVGFGFFTCIITLIFNLLCLNTLAAATYTSCSQVLLHTVYLFRCRTKFPINTNQLREHFKSRCTDSDGSIKFRI